MVSSFIQLIRSTTATNKLFLLLPSLSLQVLFSYPRTSATWTVWSHSRRTPSCSGLCCASTCCNQTATTIFTFTMARTRWGLTRYVEYSQSFIHIPDIRPFSLYTRLYTLVGPFCARFLPRRVACNERPLQCCQQWLYNRLFMGHPHTHTPGIPN